MNPSPHPSHPSAWELSFPVGLLLLLLLVPLVVVDLYPISSAPMFNEEPRLYCDYCVKDKTGQELPLEWFHLHRNDNGNPPGFGHGKIPRWSLDRLGRKPTPTEVTQAVQAGLREKGWTGPVEVSWWVIGDLDGNKIGIIDANQIQVALP